MYNNNNFHNHLYFLTHVSSLLNCLIACLRPKAKWHISLLYFVWPSPNYWRNYTCSQVFIYPEVFIIYSGNSIDMMVQCRIDLGTNFPFRNPLTKSLVISLVIFVAGLMNTRCSGKSKITNSGLRSSRLAKSRTVSHISSYKRKIQGKY